MSTIKADNYLDGSGGNSATINGIEPTSTSGVLSTFNAYGSAPVYACRAWVNFQGTGTVTIRAGGNVSSVVRVATGAYNIYFTDPMPDNYYSLVFACTPEVNNQHAVGFIAEMTTTYCRVEFYSAANSTNKADKAIVCVSIFR
jgi:hypothetical protein